MLGGNWCARLRKGKKNLKAQDFRADADSKKKVAGLAAFRHIGDPMDDHGIFERITMQCAEFPTFAVDRSIPRPVTTLRPTVSPQLQEAIKELVRLKHEADQLIGTRVSALFSE